MNSQQYWRKRVLYAKQKELNSEADYEDAMRSRLKDLENEFAKEAQSWLSKYAKENDQTLKEAADSLKNIDTSKFDMTLAEFEAKAKAGGFDKELNSAYYKQRIARLQKLHQQFAELATKYARPEEQNLAIGLAKQYQDTYLLDNYNKYLVVGGLDIDLAHFNEQELKNIVYQPWQGNDFSKRIWNNYTKVMPDVLTDVMFRGTALGYSHNRIERMLRDRFQSVVKSDLHRLVVTEMGHVAEQATLQFYKDSKIDQYQYLATLESHTCDICAHLDERIFYVKDKKEGINYPLIHPYCRCTTCGYIEGLPDITSRWSRDPITGKGKWIKNQPYSEWAKNSGQKLLTYTEWKKIEGIQPLRLGMLKALPAPKLTYEEERSIRNYVSSDSYKINYLLRNGYDLDDRQKELVYHLDKALDKLPKYHDSKPLQRSMQLDSVEELRGYFKDKKINDVFITDQYFSASKGVFDPTFNVQIIIQSSKTGTDLKDYTLGEEREVLFKRKTKFKVIDRYFKDNIFYLVVEEYEK